jgi:hypothetical protein
MNLCQYKNLLGEPHKGVHSIRVFNIAIVDVIMMIIGAKLLQIITNKILRLNKNFLIYLIFLFILGIIMHRLFCVRTTIDRLLFD